MFWKKLEFTSLQAWKATTLWSTKQCITVVSHIIATFITVVILTTISGVFLRSALFALSFFFIAYWVFSIFIYLYKKGQYGVFTRMIQRFWKRALWLFWLLELFLFCIYLFLAVISPQEVAYMLDNFQLVIDPTGSTKSFFVTTLNALIIILLFNIQLLLHKYNTMRQLINTIVALLLLKAVIEDFLQFFAINNFYSGYSWNHVYPNTKADNAYVYKSRNIDNSITLGVWEQEVIEVKSRTAAHYTYLLVFLKLWHTVFIFIVFVFLDNVSNRTNGVSYNSLAANLQNFYFLMFFNYILKITVVKQYLGYLGTYVFYWFFVNYNNYDISYIYYLYDSHYFCFIWYDLV